MSYELPSGKYSFTSPGYPGGYGNYYDSTIRLKGDNNQVLTITCDSFSMEDCPDCSCDFLAIGGQKYCGRAGPPSISGSELLLQTKTNRCKAAAGFNCHVTVA